MSEVPLQNEGLGAGLRQRVQPYMGRLWLGALLLSVTNIIDKAIPWMLKDAVDALADQRIEDVVRWATYCAITACVMWIVRSASRVVVFNIGRDVEFDLRGELMRHIHALGPSFFGRMGTGEVMSRATNDLAQVRLLIGFGLLNVINSLFAYVGGIGLMLSLSVELTLLSLIPYPFFILIARWFGKAIYVRSRAAQETLAKLADTAQENLAGVRVVRSFALEDQQMRRFDEVNAEAIERNMALVTIRGLMWPVLLSVGSIATVIAVWRGGEMVLDKDLTPGQFTAFIAYLGQLVWPTLALGYLLAVVQRGRASYERVAEILEFEPSITEAENATTPSGEGALRVDALSFTRGETDALQDISFEVPAGGSLAIVGTTGSGKTTLANLLARLLETPEGTVFLDDVDITRLKLLPLRSAVAVAPQEPFLFSTTVAGNIALALPDPAASDAAERIVHSAEEASVHEEILKLVDGYETVVGERGVQLSGGQKQRVALARALLNNPRVLVLDDPLSAVDARTEAAILDALDRAAKGRTMVLITNRIAAAARADQVLVLDEGRIVERGTHDSLRQGDGLYARLADKQALERELSSL